MPTAKHWSTIASTVMSDILLVLSPLGFTKLNKKAWLHVTNPAIHNDQIKLKLIVFLGLRLPCPLQAQKKPKQTSVRDRFPKQQLRDKGGRIRVIFSLNGRKLLSSSTVRFTLSAEAVSCGRQIYFRTN